MEKHRSYRGARRALSIGIAFVSLTALCAPGFAQSPPNPEPEQFELNRSTPLTAEEDTIVVNLASGADKQKVAEVLQEVNGVVTNTIETQSGGIFLVIKTPAKKKGDVEKKLAADKNFSTVLPNYKLQMRAVSPPATLTPNDPLYPSQSQLGQVKAGPAFKEFSRRKSNYPLLVIIDTGCSPTASGDSGTKILSGYDFDRGGTANNMRNNATHGTIVCNVAAAQTDNKIGCAGLAPGPVLPLRADSLASLVQCFKYIESLGNMGYKCVVNMSFGYPSPNDINNAQVFPGLHAIMKNSYEKGNVIWFQAAENESRRDPNPQLPYLQEIAGVDSAGNRSSFSGYGPHISFVAQATSVYTILNGRGGFHNGNSYSCPLVASIAAWMWAENPLMKATYLRTLLIRSCQPLKNLTKEQQGYGLPNAYDALLLSVGRAPSSSRALDDEDPFGAETATEKIDEAAKAQSEAEQDKLFDKLNKELGLPADEKAPEPTSENQGDAKSNEAKPDDSSSSDKLREKPVEPTK